MSATLIDGNKVAKEMQVEIGREVTLLKEHKGIVPGLAVVLVGENPASMVYVRNKRKTCENLGIQSIDHNLPDMTSEAELLSLIHRLNDDKKVDGILVQLPLPSAIREGEVLKAINPEKDVDGFHPINVGKMLIGEPLFLPCTPHGVQQLLIRSGIQIEGSHVVVVGRSNIVGKPVAAILVQKAKGANATVTICHTGTRDLPAITRQADILIAAMGRPRCITAEMVRAGVVVVDVGVNRIEDATSKTGFRLVGDVDFEPVKEKASAISPVPGGVGPMTITMLMHNTLKACKMHHGLL